MTTTVHAVLSDGRVVPAGKPVADGHQLRMIETVVRTVARQALLLVTPEEASDLVREYDRMESVGPLLDPTAFRAPGAFENLRSHKRLAEAFETFRAQVQRLVDEDIERAKVRGGQS